jgi:FAD dependent oxidoreductase TIGR03364
MVSRRIWLELAEQSGFFANPVGSLHLAYHPDEWQVLQEFFHLARDYPLELLTPDQVGNKSPAAVTQGLLGGLWSPTEVIVDAPQAIGNLAALLADRFGVEFHFGATVTEIAYPYLRVKGDRWRAEQIFLCSGADFETLYPDLYRTSGITKAKLQMLRTVAQPHPWHLGPALCGGLTLTHYGAFADCPTLPILRQRLQAELPFAADWHIHVMICQNGAGELIIGDSHEYDLTFDPFDRADVNAFILNYLRGFAQVPSWEIAATWHGIYAKLWGQSEFLADPEPGVTLVNGLSGAGMTLSFGLAEAVIADRL